MITEELLRAVGLVFVTIAVVALVLWLGSAALAVHRTRRLAARRPPALAALATALQGGDVNAARGELAKLRREDRIAVLIEMAFTVAGDQRRALDRIARDAGLVDQAKRWARSRQWHLRLRAARLGSFFGDGTEAEIERLLGDRNPDVRAEAAEWAGAHPTEPRIARLVELLGDPDARVRFHAQEALVAAGREGIPALAARLARETGRGAVPALRTARRIAVPDFLAPALALTADHDPDVRAAAATLAAGIGGIEAGGTLDRLLDDPEANVRRAAAEGLGYLARWRSASAIDGLLEDPEWRVRHEAALALRRMGPTGELLLRRRAEDPGSAATASARNALDLGPLVTPDAQTGARQ